MNRKVTPNEINTIREMMTRKGIPVHVWLPIMHLESGGNVAAHNPTGEDSRGLFQINLDTAPAFIKKLDLFDPVQNAAAIIQSQDWLGNTRRIKKMQGMTGPAEQAAFMWRRGIRPYWTEAKNKNIRHLSTAGLDELKEKYGLDTANEKREFMEDDYEILPKYDILDFERMKKKMEDSTIISEEWQQKEIIEPAKEYVEEEVVKPAKEFVTEKIIRALIIIVGSIAGLVAFAFLVLKPGDVIKTAVKIKSGGLVDIGKKEE